MFKSFLYDHNVNVYTDVVKSCKFYKNIRLSPLRFPVFRLIHKVKVWILTSQRWPQKDKIIRIIQFLTRDYGFCDLFESLLITYFKYENEIYLEIVSKCFVSLEVIDNWKSGSFVSQILFETNDIDIVYK